MNKDIIFLGIQQQGGGPVTIEEQHMTASFAGKEEPMMREIHMTASFAEKEEPMMREIHMTASFADPL